MGIHLRDVVPDHAEALAHLLITEAESRSQLETRTDRWPAR